MFFTDDKRVYTETIVKWVKHFRETLDENPSLGGLREGYCEGGHKAPGIKMIFDGYGMFPDESNDITKEMYAVFIHRDSAFSEEYPNQEVNVIGFFEQDSENEVCICVWYDSLENEFKVIPFEDNNSTDMKAKEVYKLIADINKKWYC
jgi:hypothetical protein